MDNGMSEDPYFPNRTWEDYFSATDDEQDLNF